MAKATTKTVTKKVIAKRAPVARATTKRAAAPAKRVHFAIRAIRNANPRVVRPAGVFARIFSL